MFHCAYRIWPLKQASSALVHLQLYCSNALFATLHLIWSPRIGCPGFGIPTRGVMEQRSCQKVLHGFLRVTLKRGLWKGFQLRGRPLDAAKHMILRGQVLVLAFFQELSGDPNPQYFLKSTTIQMGGVLQYKWYVYCGVFPCFKA